MFPENVFNRVQAELPEGQCSAVTRLKYVLWKLCLRRECVQNCGTMFFLQNTTRLTYLQNISVNNATKQSSSSQVQSHPNNRHLSTSNHIQIASNPVEIPFKIHSITFQPIQSHLNYIQSHWNHIKTRQNTWNFIQSRSKRIETINHAPNPMINQTFYVTYSETNFE